MGSCYILHCFATWHCQIKIQQSCLNPILFILEERFANSFCHDHSVKWYLITSHCSSLHIQVASFQAVPKTRSFEDLEMLEPIHGQIMRQAAGLFSEKAFDVALCYCWMGVCGKWPRIHASKVCQGAILCCSFATYFQSGPIMSHVFVEYLLLGQVQQSTATIWTLLSLISCPLVL